MRVLFDMDKKDYANCTRTCVRDSARSIIIKDGKVAMIHSLKYDYYKFPGGGIDKDESPVDAMIRETLEESGLIVIPHSVKEFGYVCRKQKGLFDEEECFVQGNYYYTCDVEEKRVTQKLDDYEAEEKFALEFVEPKVVIMKNRNVGKTPHHVEMFEREAKVLEILIKEGYFK